MPNSSWTASANCQWGSILRDTSDLFLQHLVQEQEHMPETNEENRPLQKKRGPQTHHVRKARVLFHGWGPVAQRPHDFPRPPGSWGQGWS